MLMQELTMQHIVGRLPGVHIAHAPLERPPHGVEHRLDVPADEDHCYTGQQPAQEALVRDREANGWTVEAQQGRGAVDGQRCAARGQPCCCHVPACAASHCRQSAVQASTRKSSLVSSSGLCAALMPARSTHSTVPASNLRAGRPTFKTSDVLWWWPATANTHRMQGEG